MELVWLMIACIGIPAAVFVIFYVADAWVRVHALDVMLEYAKKVDQLNEQGRDELAKTIEQLGFGKGKEKRED